MRCDRSRMCTLCSTCETSQVECGHPGNFFLFWCHRVYMRWSGCIEAREHNAPSLCWVHSFITVDEVDARDKVSRHCDTEERRQGVGSKCLVPQLFERRFVSMVSLGVPDRSVLMHLVGCAAPGHVFALKRQHVERWLCVFGYPTGGGETGSPPPKSTGYFCVDCGFFGGRGIARPPSSSRPRRLHLQCRCVLRRRTDWHLLPSSSHCRGVLRRRRDRPSSSQRRRVLRRRRDKPASSYSRALQPFPEV